jgi:hypothetical protein
VGRGEEVETKGAAMIHVEEASRFIHKLSHDVTGITHNIMGYATLLEEENKSEYLEGISRLVTKLNERIKSAVAEVDEGNLTEKS